MSGRKIIFVGLARDVAPFLDGVLGNIETFAAQFSAWAVLVVDNDSADNSKQLLQDWMEKARTLGAVRASLIDMDGLAVRHPVRTDRIAVARNHILQEIEQDGELRGFDYLAALDMDYPNSCPLPAGDFCKAVDFLDANSDVAGVFPNSLPLYYDIWALREKDWCPDDCWQEVARAHPALSLEDATRKYVFDRQRFIDPSGEPMGVDSAFGGMGIYRLTSVLGMRYVGLDADGSQVCEHVAFHESIRREGGQFFILPEWLNLTSFEHTGLSASHVMMRVGKGTDGVEILAAREQAAQRAQFPKAGEKFAELAGFYSRRGGGAIMDLAPQGGTSLVQARLHGCQSRYQCVEEDEMAFFVLRANALMHGKLFGDYRVARVNPQSGFLRSDGAEFVRLCTGNDAPLLLALDEVPRDGIYWARIEGPDQAQAWSAALNGARFDQVMVFNGLGTKIISGALLDQKEKMTALFPRLPHSGGGLDLVFFSKNQRGLFEEFRA